MRHMTIAVLALLAVSMGTCSPAYAQEAPPDPSKPACRGGVVPESFEARFPPNMQRHDFGLSELAPFSALWANGRRPALPLSPDVVTVYEVPGQPYILGYQHAGCIVALLAVDREKFFKLMRPVIGWQA